MLRNNRWILLLLLFAFRIELFSQTKVQFSRHGGFYDEPFALSLGCSNMDCHICYTTNGDTPTDGSFRYETPLFLDERLYSVSNIHTIPTAPVFEPFVPDSVQHAIVIRAAAFDRNGQRVSEVATQTYLIHALGCDHHGLPAVSVCCDSLSLFDYDTGIIVPGVFFDPDNPDFSGNYYQRGSEWERLCNVEFYEHDNTGINQICGIRTHGNRARKAPAKGLKIYAREKYGKKRFKHHFFETTPIESFKHLILKPFSTYWPCVGIQDYLANRMALNLGLEAPNSRPVVVYLNGEYWGVYFLQEKLDDRYLEDHFDLAPEQCNVIGDWDGEVEAGDSVRFEQMMDWLEDADLSDSANYAYLDGLIDVDNFIDYQILETFIANTDWPANNFRCWQSGDSKWRFAFFDGDAALVDKDYDVLGNATYNGNDLWQTGGNSTLLMRRLLENNDFKLRFAQRVDELCGTAWLYDSLSPLLDGVVQELRDEIPRQIERFGYPENMDYWDYGVFFVRNFLLDRFETYRMACADFEPLKISHYQSNTDDFVVYPNPVEDVANIMMLDGRSRVVNYELIDVSGACRMSGVVYLPVCAAAHLPLEVHSGVYLLKIGNQTHKIVKY